MGKRVMVAMSGGVDSSVAAIILRDAGHEVTGVTLKLWGGEAVPDSGCCSLEDVEDARRVAAQIGIPHYVFNMTEEFESKVVAPYVDAYVSGSTPNPCVECNRHMKFGMLLDRALDLGFDALATGHHARTCRSDTGTPELWRGRDALKDQSYVLAMLGQRELEYCIFPVGEISKGEVRAIATSAGLRTAEKAESMDVCFVARTERSEFVAARRPMEPGPIVDLRDGVVGEHGGIAAFTVGQRRGVGVAMGERRYVLDVDAPTATVTIGRREDLLRNSAEVSKVSFVGAPLAASASVLVQSRAHGEVAPARFQPVSDSVDQAVLYFELPQPRIAPGQLVAFYDPTDPDRLIGGGTAR